MHKITKAVIKNYKSIKSAEFNLDAYTGMVGNNNAGKTNIMDAIIWGLKRSSLSKDYFNDINLPIEVELTISGVDLTLLGLLLPQNQQNGLIPYIFSNEIRIKRVQPEPDFRTADIKTQVYDGTSRQANPLGFDNNLGIIFPEPIFIGAMENAEEDISKSKKTTTIGKLLELLISPINTAHGATIQASIANMNELFAIGSPRRINEMNDFDSKANNNIQEFFPGISIKAEIPMPEVKEIFGNGTLKVYETGSTFGRDVSQYGHGTQRAIQMALIKQLADSRGGGTSITTTLIFIDEPELYLHPHAIEVLKESLKKLSENGYQIIFNSHSPQMFNHKDIGNTLIIRKNTAIGTYANTTILSAVGTLGTHQVETLYSLTNSSKVLFSEKIILSEGKTEKKLFPEIYKKETRKSLGSNKIGLVEVGGCPNIKNSIVVLETIGIDYRAIVDLDYVLREGERVGLLSIGDLDVLACKSHLSTIASSKGITLNGDWPKGNGTISAEMAFSILALETTIQTNIQNLHNKMKNLNIWMWRKGAIEEYLGLPGKTETIWANFLNDLDSASSLSTVPGIDYNEMRDLISWINS